MILESIQESGRNCTHLKCHSIHKYYDTRIVWLSRGIELYNDSKFQDAENHFDKSLDEPQDAVYTSRATFWKAETDYNLTDYDDALVGFKQFQQQIASAQTPEIANIDYNLAYT